MNASPTVVAVITARGGSKGIVGKNIKPVAGQPLIAWTIAAAERARRLSRVIVSTDDPEIARVAAEHGAEIPFVRPEALAQDGSSHLSVLLHALDWLKANGGEPEYLCLLQPTSPLRTAEDIDAAIELAVTRRADAVIGVTPITQHPYLARRLGPDGTLVDFVKSDLAYPRRQDFPPACIINGAIYINRSASLRRDQTLLPAGALGYMMPEERSVDVDTELDLILVEHLLKQRHGAV
jgi:CMP-N,N'-diacetyllegionaminic acid synthase